MHQNLIYMYMYIYIYMYMSSPKKMYIYIYNVSFNFTAEEKGKVNHAMGDHYVIMYVCPKP